jgi:hypothetical protein
MEASDEGRKAEDIPEKEIADSLHQAEVSILLSDLRRKVLTKHHNFPCIVHWRASSSNEQRIQGGR